MTTGPTEDGPRGRLIAAGLHALEVGGPEALQARKLAADIGMSTMAVYTHFGGLPTLFEELVREGFVQFGHRLAETPQTDDPMADLIRLGATYREYAASYPQRYRLMFGATGPEITRKAKQDLTAQGSPTSMPEASATFDQLTDGVRRVMTAGRFAAADPVAVAGQLWSAIHGYVLLEMTGTFGADGHGWSTILTPMMFNLFVGLGDDPDAVRRSLAAAATTPS